MTTFRGIVEGLSLKSICFGVVFMKHFAVIFRFILSLKLFGGVRTSCLLLHTSHD